MGDAYDKMEDIEVETAFLIALAKLRFKSHIDLWKFVTSHPYGFESWWE